MKHAYLAVREECPCVMDRTAWRTETLSSSGIVRTCLCPKLDSCATGRFLSQNSVSMHAKRHLHPSLNMKPFSFFYACFCEINFRCCTFLVWPEKTLIILFSKSGIESTRQCPTYVKTKELTCVYFKNDLQNICKIFLFIKSMCIYNCSSLYGIS